MSTQGNSNSYIKVISWNINGTQNITKLKKCLLYLKARQADIVLLQETHMRNSEAKKLRKGMGRLCISYAVHAVHSIVVKEGWQYLYTKN